MAVVLTGSTYTTSLSHYGDGTLNVTVPLDAEMCVILMGLEGNGTNLSDSSLTWVKLNWDNGTSVDFTLISRMKGASYPSSGVEARYMLSGDSNWPGSGSKTIYFDNYGDYDSSNVYKPRVAAFFLKGMSTTDPIGDIQAITAYENAADQTITTALDDVAANDYAIMATGYYGGTPTITPSGYGQTSIAIISGGSSSNSLAVCGEAGEDALRQTLVDYGEVLAFVIKEVSSQTIDGDLSGLIDLSAAASAMRYISAIAVDGVGADAGMSGPAAYGVAISDAAGVAVLADIFSAIYANATAAVFVGGDPAPGRVLSGMLTVGVVTHDILGVQWAGNAIAGAGVSVADAVEIWRVVDAITSTGILAAGISSATAEFLAALVGGSAIAAGPAGAADRVAVALAGISAAGLPDAASLIDALSSDGVQLSGALLSGATIIASVASGASISCATGAAMAKQAQAMESVSVSGLAAITAILEAMAGGGLTVADIVSLGGLLDAQISENVAMTDAVMAAYARAAMAVSGVGVGAEPVQAWEFHVACADGAQMAAVVSAVMHAYMALASVIGLSGLTISGAAVDGVVTISFSSRSARIVFSIRAAGVNSTIRGPSINFTEKPI